jgi:hypothetical protein
MRGNRESTRSCRPDCDINPDCFGTIQCHAACVQDQPRQWTISGAKNKRITNAVNNMLRKQRNGIRAKAVLCPQPLRVCEPSAS